MSNPSCVFCDPPAEAVFYSGERVVGLWDAFPVSPGHALIVPRRHIENFFEATPDEQAELLRALSVARAAVESTRQPDGYNVGINVGEAAGQTIFHLHIHLIPRFSGDVPDPRGGVRHVIPAKGNYLLGQTEAAEMAPADRIPALVRGGERDPLLPHLLDRLSDAVAVNIAAAFTLESGVRLIEEHLRDVLSRGGRVRLITGDYLEVTEPAALYRLLDLQNQIGMQGKIELRIFETRGVSFHPKAYLVRGPSGDGSAFIGSSNLSETALRRGVEWNYRIVTQHDEQGYNDVVRAFGQLWVHPSVKPLDAAWVDGYAARRTGPIPRAAGVEPESVEPPPAPHSVQQEALAALQATRAAGNTAGLVVLATGLGKTWLSAFDSHRPEFPRVLFVAHREEILTQAMRTFRAIRPTARLGYYTGTEKMPDADVLFASIQTLGRQAHLGRFDPRHFDYVVVDEFHHAAARTYRRLLGYLEPRFLLGLTATPERTDGGDLLSLCGDNLVYRCDVADGIRRDLLAPFAYYGVPDEVDYENIPWRSGRFDEARLTQEVATQTRAQNALEQYQKLGGTRTISFCVSQRHADFMAAYFHDAEVRAVAVHSGATSAPRALSLEQLAAGELDVIFAVDMFNEGVDLPNIDTVLMLRPTESRILWLQQFGRGLRHVPGKTLKVIDYIGNHRVFLTNTRALLGLGGSDRELSYALDQLQAGTLELPPGCSVIYDLQTMDILRALIRPTLARGEVLEQYYRDFRELHGVRPLAVEVFEDGFDPKSARAGGHPSWLAFVGSMGDGTVGERQVIEKHGGFLAHLEITPMTRSYKMLVLLAMIGEGAFPGKISIERLTERVAEFARRYAVARTELGEALENSADLQRLLINNPIEAWAGGRGTGQVEYFAWDGATFSTRFEVEDGLEAPLRDLAQEIAEWRLAVYVRRMPAPGSDRIVCRVSQSSGTPILFLPDRNRTPGIPEGWCEVVVDGENYQAKFAKIAVNVLTPTGSPRNMLPALLRWWFGPEAGQTGRSHFVAFERENTGYRLAPLGTAAADDGPQLWQRYTRAQAAEALGIKFGGWEQQSGIVERPDQLVFFVTLEKAELDQAYQYQDRFLGPDEFQWQSQNRNTQASALGQRIRNQLSTGLPVHLFARRQKKVSGRTSPFVYCGMLQFDRWQGDRPITVWWRLRQPVPSRLFKELKIGAPAADANHQPR